MIQLYETRGSKSAQFAVQNQDYQYRFEKTLSTYRAKVPRREEGMANGLGLASENRNGFIINHLLKSRECWPQKLLLIDR